MKTGAYQKAVKRLARRDHSEDELRRALRKDGFSADDVGAALARLRERRWLNDGDLAVRLARTRISLNRQGRNRVRAELRRRGVDRAIIEAGLTEALQDVSEAEALDAVARRYWRQRSAEEPRRRVVKLRSFLLRRGFPAQLVHDRLRALWPRWRDLLEDLPEPEEIE